MIRLGIGSMSGVGTVGVSEGWDGIANEGDVQNSGLISEGD